MIPTANDRIDSIIRALSQVVLPALPKEASLAQEQAQLSIGHLQILRAQLDGLPGFEAQRLIDAKILARALLDGLPDCNKTQSAKEVLHAQLEELGGESPRNETLLVNHAVDILISAGFRAGAKTREQLMKIVLEHEKLRTRKDREWLAPFGFDTLA